MSSIGTRQFVAWLEYFYNYTVYTITYTSCYRSLSMTRSSYQGSSMCPVIRLHPGQPDELFYTPGLLSHPIMRFTCLYRLFDLIQGNASIPCQTQRTKLLTSVPVSQVFDLSYMMHHPQTLSISSQPVWGFCLLKNLARTAGNTTVTTLLGPEGVHTFGRWGKWILELMP